MKKLMLCASVACAMYDANAVGGQLSKDIQVSATVPPKLAFHNGGSDFNSNRVALLDADGLKKNANGRTIKFNPDTTVTAKITVTSANTTGADLNLRCAAGDLAYTVSVNGAELKHGVQSGDVNLVNGTELPFVFDVDQAAVNRLKPGAYADVLTISFAAA